MRCGDCPSFHRQDTCPMSLPRIEIVDGQVKVHESLCMVDEGDCKEHLGGIVFSETECELE